MQEPKILKEITSATFKDFTGGSNKTEDNLNGKVRPRCSNRREIGSNLFIVLFIVSELTLFNLLSYSSEAHTLFG